MLNLVCVNSTVNDVKQCPTTPSFCLWKGAIDSALGVDDANLLIASIKLNEYESNTKLVARGKILWRNV